MLHQNRRFLAVLLVLVCAFAYSSYAAPAVKRLGMSNSGNIQNSNVTPSKASITPSKSATSSMSRPASVRLVGSSVTPVAKVGGTTSLNAKAKTAGTADTERLAAIGKNLVKTKIISGTSVQPQGVDNSALIKRITDLENQIDAKQENLEAGDGIIIDGNTISVSEEIAGLPEKVSDLNDKVDIANLSSNYYTICQTQEYLEENYYTKAYVDQIVSQLSGANVVSQFDPSFLHQNTGN